MIVANSWPRFQQRADASTSSRWSAYMLALCGLATVSCGDTLVPGSSLDKLEFSFDGVLTVPPGDEPGSPLRIGLLWVDPAQAGKGNYASGSELVRTEIQSDGTYTAWAPCSSPSAGHSIAEVLGPGGTRVQVRLGRDHPLRRSQCRRDVRAGTAGGRLTHGRPDVYRGMPTDRALLYFSDTIRPHEQVFPELTFPANKGYHIGLIRCLVHDQSPAVSTVIQEISRPSRQSRWSHRPLHSLTCVPASAHTRHLVRLRTASDYGTATPVAAGSNRLPRLLTNRSRKPSCPV